MYENSSIRRQHVTIMKTSLRFIIASATALLLLSGCSKSPIGTWQGTDGLHDVLTFSENSRFQGTFYMPSSMPGRPPIPLTTSGMWQSTGEDTISFQEGGEVTSGKFEGDTLVLSSTGGTSLQFRRSR